MNELIEQTELSKTGGGVLSEMTSSRASQEVQAAMVIAKRFPRDETTAMVKIKNACKRKKLAEMAIYSYPRGGVSVEGPSIRLAEAIAQCWGNLDFGVVELEQRNGESTCMAYCWDLETNTRQTKIFQIKHVRDTKAGQKALRDSRDVYELVANQGARRVRACILGVIPGDVIDEAIEEVNKTLKVGDSRPIGDRVRSMAVAFDEIGVTKNMIEQRLRHNLEAVNEQELITLRKIYQSLKDGASSREDWFTLPTSSVAGSVDDALANETKKEEVKK